MPVIRAFLYFWLLSSSLWCLLLFVNNASMPAPFSTQLHPSPQSNPHPAPRPPPVCLSLCWSSHWHSPHKTQDQTIEGVMGDWLYGAWPRHASITTFSGKKKKSRVEFVAFVVGILCCLQEHRGTLSWYTKWPCEQWYKHIERICALVFLVNFPHFLTILSGHFSQSVATRGLLQPCFCILVRRWNKIQEVQFEQCATSMSFNTHQTREHHTAVYYTVGQDFYNAGIIFILRLNEASRYKGIYQERALACIWRCIALW